MINENYKAVPLMGWADVTPGGKDCDSINMAEYHKATFILGFFGTVVGNITVTAKSGAADGVKTNNVDFKYAVGTETLGTAGSDVLGAWTNSSSGATAATSEMTNKMMVVEVSGQSITEGDKWLTVTVAASTSGPCHAFAILEPRYKAGQSKTALA